MRRFCFLALAGILLLAAPASAGAAPRLSESQAIRAIENEARSYGLYVYTQDTRCKRLTRSKMRCWVHGEDDYSNPWVGSGYVRRYTYGTDVSNLRFSRVRR